MNTPVLEPGPTFYPAQGYLTLIGRAWNLFRRNWKTGMLLMSGPVLFQTLLSILGSWLSSGTFLVSTTNNKLLGVAFIALLTIAGWFLYMFVWGFCACALSRFYYSAIIQETPSSLKACWAFIRQNVASLLALFFLALVGLVFMTLLDGLLLFIGGLTSGFFIGALAVSGRLLLNPTASSVMMVVFLLLWGFAILGLLLSFISLQSFSLMGPFLTLVTAPSAVRLSSWQAIQKSMRQVFSNIPRLIPFTLLLFFFTWVILLTLTSPVLLWAGLEFKRLGADQQHHIPLYISTAINVARGLVELVSAPFLVSAFTLFWYDLRVRKDGLDLRLWFNKLLRNRGQQPADYHTDLSMEMPAAN